jgi:tetratricopeptide (TPR) repeat protein
VARNCQALTSPKGLAWWIETGKKEKFMARTQKMAEKSYEIAKQIHNRESDKDKAKAKSIGINILNKQYGMTPSSASRYINGIIGMLNGQMYKWQMREEHTEYFLTMIEKEFGLERLKRALLAVKEHINFRHSRRMSCNVKELYNSFMQKLGVVDISGEKELRKMAAEKGNYDRAISDYTEAIRLKPNYAKAYYNRGNAYREKGDYDRAISDYNEAIRLNPKDANAYHSRGVAYYHKGEEEAIENLKKRGQKQ